MLSFLKKRHYHSPTSNQCYVFKVEMARNTFAFGSGKIMHSTFRFLLQLCNFRLCTISWYTSITYSSNQIKYSHWVNINKLLNETEFGLINYKFDVSRNKMFLSVETSQMTYWFKKTWQKSIKHVVSRTFLKLMNLIEQR